MPLATLPQALDMAQRTSNPVRGGKSKALSEKSSVTCVVCIPVALKSTAADGQLKLNAPRMFCHPQLDPRSRHCHWKDRDPSTVAVTSKLTGVRRQVDALRGPDVADGTL